MIDLTLTGIAVSLAAVGLATVATASREEVPKISKEEARSMLERSELTPIDVRLPHDWEASDVKILDAIREDPKDIDSWANKYSKDKTLLLY